MKFDIIIAGAGHGGLIAAEKLAKHGFKIAVFEKNSKENVSWDWGDHFKLEVFDRIGLPEPDKALYRRPSNFTFSSPNEEHVMSTDVPEENRDIYMERRDLVNLLIDHAQNAGAKIKFNLFIKAPIIKDGKIIGIKTKENDIHADLVIDSAGINTPIKSQLPESYGISSKLNRGELFHTYRGYFNRIGDEAYFKTTLGYKNLRGISWINTCYNYADILIGSIDPFKEGEIESYLNDLRKKHSTIGLELQRGGQVVPIPVRRTAPMLVGPNYAVIGDAAYMTIPISGSGIANSMIAGDILAHTVINAHEDSKDLYLTEDLWQYQTQYYQEIGSEMAFIDILKNFLMTTPFKDMNYLFQKRILNAKDFEASIIGNEVKISFLDMVGRVFRGFGRIGLLLNLGSQITKALSVKKHYWNIPKEYEASRVVNWINIGERFFLPYYKKLNP